MTRLRVSSPRLADALSAHRQGLPGIGPGDASDVGRGRIALVTGASSGIGMSMCELLAAKGYDLVAVARRTELLKELADRLGEQWSVRVHPLPCDLADPDGPAHISADLARRGLAIDYLVNNAGYVVLGPYVEHPWERHLQFVRVMALSVSELCHRLLPHMMEQRWGRIVNMGSSAAFMPGSPGLVLYPATKSFVHKFSVGLAYECESYGIHCTGVAVGPTDTPIARSDSIWPVISQMVTVQLTLQRPEALVRQAYQACEEGRRFLTPSASSKLWRGTYRYLPAKVQDRLVKFTAEFGRN